MEKQGEKTATYLIFGGIIAMAVGLVLSLILSMGAFLRIGTSGPEDRAALWLPVVGPAILALGFLSLLAGLIYGIKAGRSVGAGAVGKLTYDPQARVIMRFGVNKYQETLTSDWMFEGHEGVRYYVKLHLSNGVIEEFETRPEVYANCADGMFGRATFDRGWLGSFVPIIGGVQPPPVA